MPLMDDMDGIGEIRNWSPVTKIVVLTKGQIVAHFAEKFEVSK